MSKRRTLRQVETAQRRAELAARNLLQDDDRADEIAEMTPQEYAESKGISISNPHKKLNQNGGLNMPTIRDLTATVREQKKQISELEGENQELQDRLSEIRGIVADDDFEDEDEFDDSDDVEDDEE